jgi:hypothetical protein
MTRDDSILGAVRLIAAIIVVVLVLAVIVLYLMPGQTERFWAWTITPPMTPLLMGAGYAAGAYFFTRALIGRSWRSITVGFPPIAAFTTLLLIATVLHWDRFNHTHIAFFAWTFLYAITPLLIPAVWLVNCRRDPGREAGELLVPSGSRAALALVGASICAVALVMFVRPGMVIDDWPWDLTPLTARVIAAYLALTGVSLGLVALDARWRAAKVIIESLAVGTALIIGGIIRDWDSLDPAAGVSWLYLASMVLGLALLGGLYASMEARARSGVPSADEAPGVTASR